MEGKKGGGAKGLGEQGGGGDIEGQAGRTELVRCKVMEKVSPVCWLKSIKNKAELDGLREAHVRDGVAVCSFLAWMKEVMEVERKPITEITAAAKLESFRKAQDGYGAPILMGSGYEKALRCRLKDFAM